MAKISHIAILTLLFIVYHVKSQTDENSLSDDEQKLGGGIGQTKDKLAEEFVHPTGTTGMVRGIIEDLIHRRKTTRRPKPGPDPGPRPTVGPDPEPDPIRRTTPSHHDGDRKEAAYPGGNVIFQLTRKGLDTAIYYMQLFSDSWTKQFDIDTAQMDGQEIKNVHMIRGDIAAKIQVFFVIKIRTVIIHNS